MFGSTLLVADEIPEEDAALQARHRPPLAVPQCPVLEQVTTLLHIDLPAALQGVVSDELGGCLLMIEDVDDVIVVRPCEVGDAAPHPPLLVQHGARNTHGATTVSSLVSAMMLPGGGHLACDESLKQRGLDGRHDGLEVEPAVLDEGG